MKVMKSLLLGSAAGVVAMSGAQAADLPVKAKPVEYVKICSAYGAGFYYIPGTDICLRVGGYVRADYYFHNGPGTGTAPFYPEHIGTNLQYDRDDTQLGFRGRGTIILDARTNTSYGTLRSYLAVGGTATTPATAAATAQGTNVDAAFIQFAGFTFGWARSFYDFGSAYSYNAPVGATLRAGIAMLAYTAQLGNGVSATLSLENGGSQRINKIVRGTYGCTFTPASVQAVLENDDLSDVSETAILHVELVPSSHPCAVSGGYSGANTVGALGGNMGGQYFPDVIANVRVDQAWGSAQFMAAAHHLRVSQALADAGVKDKWGYAVGAGIEVKLDSIAPRDRAMIQGTWSKGATEYNLPGGVFNGNVGVGHRSASSVGPLADLFDAGVVGSGSLELSKAWSVAAQFQHYWTPTLRSNIGGGYFKFSPASNVQNQLGFPDARVWQATVATIWSPVANLDLGVELFYSHVKTKGGFTISCASSNQTEPDCSGIDSHSGNSSKGVWSGMIRAQRNF